MPAGPCTGALRRKLPTGHPSEAGPPGHRSFSGARCTGTPGCSRRPARLREAIPRSHPEEYRDPLGTRNCDPLAMIRWRGDTRADAVHGPPLLGHGVVDSRSAPTRGQLTGRVSDVSSSDPPRCRPRRSAMVTGQATAALCGPHHATPAHDAIVCGHGSRQMSQAVADQAPLTADLPKALDHLTPRRCERGTAARPPRPGGHCRRRRERRPPAPANRRLSGRTSG